MWPPIEGRIGTVAILAAVILTAARAGHAETGRDVLDRLKTLNDTTRHWNNRQQTMKLTISGRGGDRVRDLKVFERKEGQGEEKSIAFFLSPPDVKGTAFLAFTHKGRAADQWLFLPELQRVRQITSRLRNESFVGTDLSYHDLDLISEMVNWTDEDATSSLRPAEALDGINCHVIELVPRREDIGYKKLIVWLSVDDLIFRQREFFADDPIPSKRIVEREIKNIGSIPVAHNVRVETPAKNTQTVIEVTAVEFDRELPDDLFTQRRLERGAD